MALRRRLRRGGLRGSDRAVRAEGPLKRVLAVLAALAAPAAGLAACGPGGAGAQRPAEGGVCERRGQTADLGGGALLHLPARGGDGPWPLVVALHGAGGSATQAAFLGFSGLGDREGFAALYPTARARGFWSLNPSFRPDDLPAVRALLDRVLAEPCLDRTRVFVTGVSNGGGFTARLGCELPVRAIAPVAAGFRAVERCPSGRPVGVFVVHGTADRVVPYRGRPPERLGSVPRYLQTWARRNRCARTPASTRPRRLVVRQRWRGCRAPVEHLRLQGTGHGWPGIGASAPGDPTGVEATRAIWRFFSAF